MSTSESNSAALLHSICVFSGSRTGTRPEYRAAAEVLADELVRRRIALVYGGGDIGLMGVMADRMLGANGKVFGVIPRCLVEKEVAHHGVTQLHVVDTMHARKALMADLSDAFIAIPGGFGTLEELFEVVTWRQLAIHAKPCGVLNTAGYFDDLLRFLDRAVEDGFVREEHFGQTLVDDDPHRLLDRIARSAVASSGVRNSPLPPQEVPVYPQI
jgi:uncharacterized protein (TIGR00730 family)